MADPFSSRNSMRGGKFKMDNEVEYLVHHGILGQKWGVRRYRNKDGTLTAAGKKRLAKLEAERDFLNDSDTDRQKKEDNTAKITKDARSMTDEELRNAINRLGLENQYKKLAGENESKANYLQQQIEEMQLEKNYRDLYKQLNPTKDTSYINDVKKMAISNLTKAVSESGSEYIKAMMKKSYSTDSQADMDAILRKEAEELYAKGKLAEENKKQQAIKQYITNKTPGKSKKK